MSIGYIVTVRGPLPADLAQRIAAAHAAAVRGQKRPAAADRLLDGAAGVQGQSQEPTSA